MDWFKYEKLYNDNGNKIVCGIDEAGRGPLAGSVYAAAVILPENTIIDGANDSKKLTEKKREYLFEVIKEKALSYNISFSTPEEIEEYLAKIDVICESVVVGRREDDETKLVAVIYPSYQKYPDLSESEIRTEIQKEITALNKKLPSFKQIHKLEFRKTEFEKTTTKKIKRHLVK